MRRKPSFVTNDKDWERFSEWADDYGIGDHEDDWMPWFDCWLGGRKSAYIDINEQRNKNE